MNTIINEKINELEIKKSKFISIILKIDNTDCINTLLNRYKKEYPKATHYCYAFSINGLKKSSDDGEPGGSAGLPIMEIINKNDLNNVLVIVIRYFGGIKLGMGGLIRAYSESVRELVKENIKEEIKATQIEIKVSYQEQSKIDNLFKKYIIEKKYKEEVTYIINVPNNILENININYKKIKDLVL